MNKQINTYIYIYICFACERRFLARASPPTLFPPPTPALGLRVRRQDLQGLKYCIMCFVVNIVLFIVRVFS